MNCLMFKVLNLKVFTFHYSTQMSVMRNKTQAVTYDI